jgi:hypothetical protein
MKLEIDLASEIARWRISQAMHFLCSELQEHFFQEKLYYTAVLLGNRDLLRSLQPKSFRV